MLEVLNFINGRYLPALKGGGIDDVDPSNGTLYAKITRSRKEDVEDAYQAAKKAFPAWSETPQDKRAAIMLKIANGIEARLDELAKAESQDNGKPYSLAKKVDIPRSAKNFRFFAHAITQFSTEAHESVGNNTINFTLRQPIGVVGCISPWNLPLYLFSWKIAPALAAGNTVVAKPSEITPVTAFLLGEIVKEAGLPDGVLNIVHGYGPEVGQALVEHPGIKAISFTGGTKTGGVLAATAAPMFKKLSLELGGKNPNLIFADCDKEKMLQTTLRSSFANQGQICLCGSRIFVERSYYDSFKEDFVEAVKTLKVGHPMEDVDLGAVATKQHQEKIQSYIQMALEDGGTLLCGGQAVTVPGHEGGFYLQPTVIEVPSNDCRINQEEVFGPVVTIMPFDTEEQAIALANDVPYGLASTVWSGNVDRVMRVGKQLEAGIVWVNTWLNRDLRTPFGGMKESGVGREGGLEALRFFTEPKNICIQYNN